jgi:hypothetical protein
MGDSHCISVYLSTHRAAAGFLRELAPRYADAQAHLEQAAESFIAEADALGSAMPLLLWEAPVGPDPERNAQLVPLLRRARDGYARAMVEIERAIEAMSMPGG